MTAALTIQSHSHPYTVEYFPALEAALASITPRERALWLVDRRFAELYPALAEVAPAERTVLVAAGEEQKSFEVLTPIFLELLKRGLKRDGRLVVVGGGVLQDIGCFVATVLFRGIRWELVPTTLLAQADSCIGSKSSINIGSYKNQIGTFYPPHRVLLVPGVLATLPRDEIRSGLGEVIKLQLLAGEAGFRELMEDLRNFAGQPEILGKWVRRSMEVKQPYIEADEFDRGIRNLLNYGHTFGHAYESATHYGIPHGIAVVLGMLTATRLSARLGLVPSAYADELERLLAPWHRPFAETLRQAPRQAIFSAIKHDKKNTGEAVNCILTHGFGRMEKRKVALEGELIPAVNSCIDTGFFPAETSPGVVSKASLS
ncbi:MAG: AroB-related putative sugar phosphate phospholyase (cyclizing) [Opitutaceae bacterium]|jgi:3-dehydroquinate synthase